MRSFLGPIGAGVCCVLLGCGGERVAGDLGGDGSRDRPQNASPEGGAPDGQAGDSPAPAGEAGAGEGGSPDAPGAGGPCSVVGARRDCFPGPIEQAGKGVCRVGWQECAGDPPVWGACQGFRAPDPAETCDNGVDDDCNGATDCGDPACAASPACVGKPCPPGAPCDADHDGCTLDTCDAEGRCAAGPRADCSDACNTGTCRATSATTFACDKAHKPDGTACDLDFDPCTADACSSGACRPGPARDCSAAADACNTAICVSEQGGAFRCGKKPKPAGTSCSGGNSCTTGDTCDGTGVCRPGTAVDCGAGDACNDEVCVPGDGTHACVRKPKPVGTSCSDGDSCTLGDACDGAGACKPGPPRDCSALDDACNVGVCASRGSEVTFCIKKPKPAGASCNADDNGCTAGDTCDGAGTCKPGVVVDCGGNACNNATCQSTGADSYTCSSTPKPAGAPCNADDNGCTAGDACDGAGACKPGPVPACTSDPCSTGVCSSTGPTTYSCTVTRKAGWTCVPGGQRYCDTPIACRWGHQTCLPDGTWGSCTDTNPPSGCGGYYFDPYCCVSAGQCCQAFPGYGSTGSCGGIVCAS